MNAYKHHNRARLIDIGRKYLNNKSYFEMDVQRLEDLEREVVAKCKQ
jgi:hypothetical protein